MSGAKRPYRPGVGVMLLNRRAQVWVGRRIDNRLDAWQMPQGGLDKGEAPRAGALRELQEETGVAPRLTDTLAQSAGWLTYDLPEELRHTVWKGRYRGQRQKWFAMAFTGDDRDIDIATKKPEFDAWKWAELETLPDLIVPFKRALYADIVAEFRPIAARIAAQR